MSYYKTAEEKAAEWDVSVRHVQYLCREGKIEGAGKRVGVWFIPDDTPVPVKNTKTNRNPFRFVGTKKRIFDNSIKLFTQRGFENVSMNDIADSVGIRQSAIYNHFKSKQEILDTIYAFYYHHGISRYPGTDALEPLLRAGSLEDIVKKGFVYEFDKSIAGQMDDIAKIVTQRITMDPKSAELFRTLILEKGIRFAQDGLDRAVGLGRLAPFDTHTTAVLINCVRVFMLLLRLSNPPKEIRDKLSRDEKSVYAQIAALLTDLNPPPGK